MTTYLLSYKGSSRLGQLYTIDDQGNLNLSRSYSDVAPDWQKILPIESVWDALEREIRADVLFYGAKTDPSTPFDRLCRFDSPGELKPLRDHKVFSEEWTDIVPIPFEFCTNLFFYNSTSGVGEIRRYVSSRQSHPDYAESGVDPGQGNLPLLKRYQDFAKTWTHIVPGNFGGEYGGILFYDKNAGVCRIYRVDKYGEFQQLKRYSTFSKDWSHIIPIPFGFRTDLFFYSSTAGKADIYRVDDQGDLELVKMYPESSLRKTWNHIIAIPFEDEFRGPLLLFYDRSGIGEIYKINDLGELGLISKASNYNPGLTSITVIPGFMPPSIYRIRLHAVVGCKENDQVDLQSAITYGKSTLPKVVEDANRIFKEAGIHFRFEPLTDVDIVPSRILNHEILPNDNEDRPFDPNTGLGLWEGAAVAEQIGWRCRNKLALIVRGYLRVNKSTFRMQEVMIGRIVDGHKLAHELGHYFRLGHPFRSGYGAVKDNPLGNFDKLKNHIKAWVESQAEAKTAINEGRPIPEHLFEPIVWQKTDADAINVSDTPPDLGPDIFRWTYFVQVGKGLILFYDGRTGAGAIQKLQSDGTLEQLKSYASFSKNWSHIVEVGNGLTFFYKSHKGEGVIARFDDDGSMTTLKEYTSFSKNWSHIVEVGNGLTFFYKSHKGEGVIARFDDDGSMTTLKEYTSFSKNWSHIVEVGNGLTFFYKSHKGEGVIARFDDDGSMTTLKEYTSFSKNWSHIVEVGNDLTFFYKSHKGEGVIARFDDDGSMTTLKEYADFKENWSHILGDQEGHILYYNIHRGDGTIRSLYNDGRLKNLRSYIDFGFYKCSGLLNVEVTFATGQTHRYTFNPDRSNIMGYYGSLHCPAQLRFSADQVHVMRHALLHENRRHLVRPQEFRYVS